ncbi:HpcH/HpaI aldolase/citrate lyase family protein [Naasia aerilata]|uniref:HpcH/HpaI aldolase/citrate lyase domain-containing protein n=1 Tax=Naasia aerilata TaxID=1162966 RepID=A0ABM8GDE4_9MICO|nr:aldolase/citrate lyase family protein [Naasia aerilata]BDZ46310.1 hypothetical protein GCM10025866_22190 [Naasia aerilata]
MSGLPTITGLYVPGDRPDRFEKAVASGAQLVIVDLEDAVAPNSKRAARQAVVDWLARGGPEGVTVQVRVNVGNADDLAALAALPATVQLRLPKVEAPDDVDAAVALAGERPVTALLESAAGIEAAAAIARHSAVTLLGFGQSDLVSELGSSAEPVLDYARARILFASAAAGLPAPMLPAYPGIRDLDGLRRDTERGRDQGWVGRVAVHPSQLAPIAEVFRPGRPRCGGRRRCSRPWPAGESRRWPTGPWWTPRWRAAPAGCWRSPRPLGRVREPGRTTRGCASRRPAQRAGGPERLTRRGGPRLGVRASWTARGRPAASRAPARPRRDA